ncbi:hypothetical protein CcCBS67573_g06698 [Chytriomyces confervae]|uniref:Hyaluronan/mRNA-binding protein domain-containing protein n=1 Tax=Chytriomyces confervae TaxID=246404 RepID=A0A507F2J3_9FUNG|nr:hypothetical protein HDU80_010808 [Chytriomyces hyalinus]TPX69905.1 hypothetical protein CcCBS67573_g06698 [Chytriomyces confervae]
MPNPFDLLGDVESTDTAAVVPQPKVVAPRAASPSKDAAKKAPVQRDQKKSSGAPRNNNNNNRSRAPREYTPRDTNTSDIARPDELVHADKADAKHVRDAHHRGDRRAGSGRGGRREYDRRSGTGREDGDKKDMDREPVDAEIEGSKDAEKEVAEVADENVAPVVAAEPEEKQVSLQEYLAQKAATKLAADVKARKANEGADDSQWKDAKVFEKTEEDLFSGKAPKAKKEKEAKEKKQTIDLQFKFADEAPAPRRDDRERRDDRAPRGGARGARGGAPRGGAAPRGARGGASTGAAKVNINDTNAFPTLGGK